MNDRIETEIDLLKQTHRDVEVGSGWVIIGDVSLPEGWDRSKTDVLIKIPSGYPTTPPDNFYTVPDLRLEDGSKPGNVSTEKKIAGRAWLEFSYHLKNDEWSPHAEAEKGHNLITYFEGVKKRLSNAD